MKRKANKQDIEMEKKGIERNEQVLKDSREDFMVLNKQYKMVKLIREHDDFIRPYNRKQENKRMDLQIKKAEQDIELCKERIDVAKKNLKDGYEVKERPEIG